MQREEQTLKEKPREKRTPEVGEAVEVRVSIEGGVGTSIRMKGLKKWVWIPRGQAPAEVSDDGLQQRWL